MFIHLSDGALQTLLEGGSVSISDIRVPIGTLAKLSGKGKPVLWAQTKGGTFGSHAKQDARGEPTLYDLHACLEIIKSLETKEER